MTTALYVALSAQVALERKLDIIAQNVANLATAGYRAEEIKFDAVMSKTEAATFVSSGDTYISRSAGPLTKTGNGFDVAVQGEGWLAVQSPSGVVYTRDGRMQVNGNGALTNLAGHPILDVGRAPLTIDPAGGEPNIARDGMLMQNGRQIGAIGLFAIDPAARLTRAENAGVIPDLPATEILDFNTNGILQGFVEDANVNPIMEISRLIAVSRAFEAASSAIQMTDSNMQGAIKTLGESA